MRYPEPEAEPQEPVVAGGAASGSRAAGAGRGGVGSLEERREVFCDQLWNEPDRALAGGEHLLLSSLWGVVPGLQLIRRDSKREGEHGAGKLLALLVFVACVAGDGAERPRQRPGTSAVMSQPRRLRMR